MAEIRRSFLFLMMTMAVAGQSVLSAQAAEAVQEGVSRSWASLALGGLSHDGDADPGITPTVGLQAGYRIWRGLNLYGGTTSLAMHRFSSCSSGTCQQPHFYHRASLGGKAFWPLPRSASLYLFGEYGAVIGEGPSWAVGAGLQARIGALGSLGLEAIGGADAVADVASNSFRGIAVRFNHTIPTNQD